jgi:SP family arabinose:H+ symporter-like MFS transporter
MFVSQAAPSVLFLLLLLIVPESPRWLMKKGRRNEAATIIARVSGELTAKAEIKAIEASFQTTSTVSLAALFTRPYAGVVMLGIMIAVFQQITGINSILYYAPVIFKETGLDTASSLLQTMGIGFVNVMATFIAIGLVDRVGRKKFLIAGSILMGISLVTVGLCFHFRYFENYIVLIGMLVYVASFGCTLGAVTWVYLSEIFPNRIRGLALSVATLSLWIADFVVTYTFPVMTKQLGTATTLFVYAGLCGVACVYMFIKVKETRNRSLEEIETLFVK